MEGHVSLENYRIQILAACTAIMQTELRTMMTYGGTFK